MAKSNDWQVNRDEGHTFYPGPEVTFVFRPPEVFTENWWADELREETLALLDTRFRRMHGDLVADVADILFLHWYKNGRPEKALITLAQVLAYRNVKPDRKTLERHWNAMRDVRSIRLRGGPIEDIALFDIDAVRLPHPNLFGCSTPPSAGLVYVYSPGWFIGQAVNQIPYVADYVPRLLALDPYRFNVAKRIARYLRGEWRMNPEGYLCGPQPRYRAWREHLKDAAIEPGERARKHQSEFLGTLDDQLLALVRIGVLRDWVPDLHRPGRLDSLKQPWEEAARFYHPEDRERLRRLPFRNRLAAFLALRVHLAPPEALTASLTRYAEKRRTRAAQIRARAEEMEVRKALRQTHKRELPG